MTINKQKIRGIGEDILGAGFHILSGAGGDMKMLIQQAVQRVMGDAYVSRAEYEALLARVNTLESGKAKTGTKTSKSAASKASKNLNKSASKKPTHGRK